MWFLIIPFLIGMIFTYFNKKEKNNLILTFISGYFIEFSIFELLAIPMTFLECKFTTLFFTYSIILGIISVISIWINRKNFKEIIIENFKNIKKLPLKCILVFIMILLQMFVLFEYMHIDDDDAFYVGNATTTIATNTISKINPSHGFPWGWQARYVLAPFSILLATWSKLVNLHPALVAHTILPVIFLPMVYMIFGLIANEIFNKDKNKTFTFLILLNILYIFGNYSRRTTYTVLFLRIWQGKAFLANIIIPAIWYFMLKYMNEENKKSNFIMLIIVMISSCLVSSMGVALAPATIMVMALIYAIRDKKISYLFKFLITCTPNIICGILYLIISLN